MKNYILALLLAVSASAFAKSANQVHIMPASGNLDTWGQVDVSLPAAVKNALRVVNGGSGLATLTLNGMLFGNGTSAVGITAAGTQYQVFQAGASGIPAVGALHLDQSAAITGTLGHGNGGTDITSPGTTGNVVTSNGTNFVSAPPVTALYYSGSMPTGSSWSGNSGTFADPNTNTGGNALTAIGTPTLTVTAAGSNLPGISFTPASSTSIYMIDADFQGANNTGGAYSAYRFYDGTNAFGWVGLAMVTTPGSQQYPIHLHGIYTPGTASPVTVKIQLEDNTGITYILNGNTGVGNGFPSISWSVVQIK